jgi:hypothetical protein
VSFGLGTHPGIGSAHMPYDIDGIVTQLLELLNRLTVHIFLDMNKD